MADDQTTETSTSKTAEVVWGLISRRIAAWAGSALVAVGFVIPDNKAKFVEIAAGIILTAGEYVYSHRREIARHLKIEKLSDSLMKITGKDNIVSATAAAAIVPEGAAVTPGLPKPADAKAAKAV